LLTLVAEKTDFVSYNKLGENADRRKIHFLLKKVVRVKPANCVGGPNGAANRWRKRVLSWNSRFLQCIAVCHDGDPEKFYNSPHTGKFPLTGSQCTCLK